MDTKEILTIASWPITLVFGILSGGFIVPRLTRKRQILTWATMTEADLIPRELSQRLGLPVTLKVGDAAPSSLTSLTIRIGNSGNEVITDVPVVIRLNKEASILNVRLSEGQGEYGKKITWVTEGNRCTIIPSFINPGRNFELELLASDFNSGSAEVDAAAPGLERRRTSASLWNQILATQSGLMRDLKVTIPLTGIGYDSGAAAMAILAEELRALRGAVDRQRGL
jgi:hypothetical protein